MATHNSMTSASADAPVAQQERELLVCIYPYNMDFTEYRGSRAQLEAEGVIPPDTEWPEGGASVSWEVGKFEFSLRRTRPDGMKGPMKLWLAGDWWNLRFQLKVRPGRGTRAIKKKAAELADAMYRHSAAGQYQHSLEWAAYWKTQEDQQFQAFKALIPALAPKRRKSPH